MLGLNKEKSIHTLPLQSLHLLSLHLQFLPLPTLRLVLLVSLIIKTYRISQCSFCIFSGALVLLCPFATRALNFITLCFIYFLFYCFNNDMWRKPREISQFGKKSAKVYHSLYSSTEQLQVALWTYMFFKLGWNKQKSLHTLPLQSLHLLCFHLQSLPL